MLITSRIYRKAMILIGTLILLLGLPIAVYGAKSDEIEGFVLRVNGSKVDLAEPALVRDGRLYLPAASLAQWLQAASIRWNSASEETVIQTALGDTIVLGDRVPVVYYNGNRYLLDASPFLRDGRMYVPLCQVAELMHATASWSKPGEPAELTTVKPAIVKTSKSDDAREGQALRVVVPSVLAKPATPYTEADFKLLAKITQVEAGSDSYEGQLAVANVIMNRVKSEDFPDSISGVIYAGKQFPPAHNGMLDKSVPKANALRAAKDALNGKNNVADAVYFFNPAVSKGGFWSSLEVVAKFGEHCFAK